MAIPVLIIGTIRKGAPIKSHTNITHLVDSNHKAWTEDYIMTRIRAGEAFYTRDAFGNQAMIRIRGPFPSQWLQTEANGIPTDNLLNLPIYNLAA